MITLKNGIVFIDNEFKELDILIDNGKIIEISKDISKGNVIDCTGKIVSPSFIDSHVHFREPGYEAKETIKQGSMAAASGGYTKVFLMPNLNPKPNSLENINLINDLIKKDSVVDCIQSGTITKDQSGLGNNLSDMEEIAPHVCGFSDDGNGVYTSSTMYEAMKIASKLNKPILSHCEDRDMLFKGVIHEGEQSKKLNLPGIPGVSETLEIARNGFLALETKCHLHICHISIKESVDLVRYLKSIGCNITCEVTPHHLTLIDEDIKDKDDANYKMNPPLSSKKDKEALIKGLLDGTIDCIATDHAPHTKEEKDKGMLSAPFGIVGLETAFSVLYTDLVKTGVIDLGLLLDKMSLNVSKIFNLQSHEIKVGNDANITVIDITNEYKIDVDKFISKGKNTPYNNKSVYGKILYTIMRGEIIYEL